jgi:hypothetical protein
VEERGDLFSFADSSIQFTPFSMSGIEQVPLTFSRSCLYHVFLREAKIRWVNSSASGTFATNIHIDTQEGVKEIRKRRLETWFVA